MKDRTELKEIAKDILMSNLSVAYYKLVDGCYEAEGLTEEEKEICHQYITKYGTSMAKAIKREYYTQ